MKYMTVREYEKNLILEDLARTKQALDNAYDHFENVVDPDLIDCYIYEVNAVQQKYKYLLKWQSSCRSLQKSQNFKAQTDPSFPGHRLEFLFRQHAP